MRTRRLAAIFVFLCTMPALAQSTQEAESKVLTLERLWASAAQMRDTKALQSIFDDSMVYVHIDGRLMTKAEVLADTSGVGAVDIVIESSSARSYGNLIVVTGVMKLKGIDKGKPYLRYGRFLDTWALKDDHWVCLSSMTTAIQK
jgi:ketosteroid isomerase-like protein